MKFYAEKKDTREGDVLYARISKSSKDFIERYAKDIHVSISAIVEHLIIEFKNTLEKLQVENDSNKK